MSLAAAGAPTFFLRLFLVLVSVDALSISPPRFSFDSDADAYALLFRVTLRLFLALVSVDALSISPPWFSFDSPGFSLDDVDTVSQASMACLNSALHLVFFGVPIRASFSHFRLG